MKKDPVNSHLEGKVNGQTYDDLMYTAMRIEDGSNCLGIETGGALVYLRCRTFRFSYQRGGQL
jgi:hypothetical protein